MPECAQAEIGAETGEDGEMKPVTAEEIMRELSDVRSQCEAVRRETKQLMCRTSRLYVELENLAHDPARKLALNNGRKL